MHILLVVGKFPELTFLLRTAQGLVGRGHRVTVAARRRGDWADFRDDLPLPAGLRVRYLLPELWRGLPMLIRAPRAACRLWRRVGGAPRPFVRYLPFMDLRPDVIQFDFPMTAHAYALLPELLRAPTVVSCRGADVHMLEQRDPAEQAARLASLRAASVLHCVSEEMARTVRRLTGRTERVWVNRPALPVERIAPKVDYPPHDPPRIVAVGRLTWKKGYDYLLAALAHLRQAGRNFHAQIIGGGELYAALRFSIGDLGLSDCVMLAGALPPGEVLRRLREADIFVLSSHEEGISNAALEAMACGLPVVTTNAGGMAEVVGDGAEGFVVPVRDIPTLTARIGRLLEDPALCEGMGRAARRRAETEFTLSRQAAVFEAMYAAIAREGA